MRYLLSSLAVSGAYAAFPNTTVYVPRGPIFTDEACFSSVTKGPVACTDANAVNINRDANNNHQPNCAHLWTGNHAGANMAGYISTDFGPAVAGMPGCCNAMIDITLSAWIALYASPYTLSHPICISESCMASNAAGNMTASLYGNGIGQHAAITAMPKTDFAGRFPDDATMIKSLKIAFQGGSKCFDAAIAHMGSNSRFNNAAVANTIPSMKTFFSSYVTSSCTLPSVTFPAADSAHCNVASTGGSHHIVSSNECYDSNKAPTTNCSVSTVTMTVNAPNCMMHSTSSGGALTMTYGPVAAAIPGCCSTLPAQFSVALTQFATTNAWQAAAQCQSLLGCIADNTTMYTDAYFVASGNHTAPNNMVGNYPNLASWNNAKIVGNKNGGECLNAANSYVAANAAVNPNSAYTSAFNNHVVKYQNLATSVGCVIDGVNYGSSVSYACCKKIRDVVLGNWAPDAYATATTTLCADTTCADKVAAALRGTAANAWTPEHKRVLDVVGVSTAHASGTPVDVCKTTLPAYLTTTSTTTTQAPNSPTTTTVSQNSNNNNNGATSSTSTTTPAPVVQVTASYTAAEVLPSGTSPADLMASTDYRSAKQTGIANGLSISQVSDVTITGFSFSRRQLSEAQRKLSSTNVETSFSIAAADTTTAGNLVTALASSASAIKNATDTAMASKSWSGDATFSAAPTMAAPTMGVAAQATVATLTSGTVTVSYFSDAACSTAHSTHSAVSGAIGVTCLAGLASDSFTVDQCNTAATKSAHSGASCGGSATTSTSMKDVCVASGTTGVWQNTACSSATYSAPGSSTSSTSTSATSGAAAVSTFFAVAMAGVSAVLFC